jgi:hypothetical protein
MPTISLLAPFAADEEGKAVHETCYIKIVLKAILPMPPPLIRCYAASCGNICSSRGDPPCSLFA